MINIELPQLKPVLMARSMIQLMKLVFYYGSQPLREEINIGGWERKES